MEKLTPQLVVLGENDETTHFLLDDGVRYQNLLFPNKHLTYYK